MNTTEYKKNITSCLYFQKKRYICRILKKQTDKMNRFSFTYYFYYFYFSKVKAGVCM